MTSPEDGLGEDGVAGLEVLVWAATTRPTEDQVSVEVGESYLGNRHSSSRCISSRLICRSMSTTWNRICNVL